MSKDRREFLKQSALGLAATAIAPQATARPDPQAPPQLPPGAPPAFGTGPKVGPPITARTFAEAEKLVQVELTPRERGQAAGNWQVSMAAQYERRNGPRKLTIGPETAPATIWDPTKIPGARIAATTDRFQASTNPARPLPTKEEDIAYAGITDQAQWIKTRQLTSQRLTTIYLQRLERFQPRLNAVITLTKDLANEQAKRADQEIESGRYKGPLHGIPWGAKDLLDTRDIPTTWGAEPYRNRRPTKNAAVVERLEEAGAVLIAKLSLGALALNDIWFGGRTSNPWLPEEGSGGSSAGPGAATAAGCVSFAVASETGGSIIGPAMRNGVTGLRPTYGRVPRTGAMTLCWSLDKLGPMARYVEDTLIVLKEISGPDQGDPGIADVKRLKQEDGPNLVTQGSTELVHALLANDLVDAMSIFTVPVVLGGGKKLFADGSAPHSFRLTRSRVSPNGLIVGHYEREGEIKIGDTTLDSPSEREIARQERMKREG